MTPAEQEAQRLIDFYRTYIRMADKMGHLQSIEEIHLAKQCAIKVCEEKIKTIVELSEGQNGYWLDVIQKQIDIKTAINNYGK